MNIGQRVKTKDGIGTIKKIEPFRNDYRVGIKHDTFPEDKPEMYKDDILFYYRKDVQIIKP